MAASRRGLSGGVMSLSSSGSKMSRVATQTKVTCMEGNSPPAQPNRDHAREGAAEDHHPMASTPSTPSTWVFKVRPRYVVASGANDDLVGPLAWRDLLHPEQDWVLDDEAAWVQFNLCAALSGIVVGTPQVKRIVGDDDGDNLQPALYHVLVTPRPDWDPSATLEALGPEGLEAYHDHAREEKADDHKETNPTPLLMALCHALEQEVDTGVDRLQWAYGVADGVDRQDPAHPDMQWTLVFGVEGIARLTDLGDF